MTKKYSKMVVIFVDLLGTKNNIKFEDKYNIHRLFHTETKINENRNKSHVIYERRVYSFSDCAYFFYFYKNGIDDSRKDDMQLLQIAIYNTSISLLRIMNAGYLLRGGISFGDSFIDELGFFGPAVEEAYNLESHYADIPIIAFSEDLGKKFQRWEDSVTDMNLVKQLMTSRPTLIESDSNKYFLNIFYQLEYSDNNLILENEIINLSNLKNTLSEVIERDKNKYSCDPSISKKLNWMEKYLKTKHNRLRRDIVSACYSTIFGD